MLLPLLDGCRQAPPKEPQINILREQIHNASLKGER